MPATSTARLAFRNLVEPGVTYGRTWREEKRGSLSKKQRLPNEDCVRGGQPCTHPQFGDARIAEHQATYPKRSLHESAQLFNRVCTASTLEYRGPRSQRKTAHACIDLDTSALYDTQDLIMHHAMTGPVRRLGVWTYRGAGALCSIGAGHNAIDSASSPGQCGAVDWQDSVREGDCVHHGVVLGPAHKFEPFWSEIRKSEGAATPSLKVR